MRAYRKGDGMITTFMLALPGLAPVVALAQAAGIEPR